MTNQTKIEIRQTPTLEQKIFAIDQVQAKRFSKLCGTHLEIAVEGIVRHLRACEKMDVKPDPGAIREIIDDAQDNHRVFALVNDDKSAPLAA